MWFQKISKPPPQRVTGNSEEEGGDLKAKIIKGKYEPKLEFPEEWGVQTKKTLHGGCMDIFWNNTLHFILGVCQSVHGLLKDYSTAQK